MMADLLEENPLLRDHQLMTLMMNDEDEVKKEEWNMNSLHYCHHLEWQEHVGVSLLDWRKKSHLLRERERERELSHYL